MRFKDFIKEAGRQDGPASARPANINAPKKDDVGQKIYPDGKTRVVHTPTADKNISTLDQRVAKFASDRERDNLTYKGAKVTMPGTNQMIAKAKDNIKQAYNKQDKIDQRQGAGQSYITKGKPVRFDPKNSSSTVKIAMDDVKESVKQAIQEHIKQKVPFTECMFRPGSEAFTLFYRTVKEIREHLDLDWQDQELLDTDIGECIMVEGELIPLDVPMEVMEQDEYGIVRYPDTSISYVKKVGDNWMHIYDASYGYEGQLDKADMKYLSVIDADQVPGRLRENQELEEAQLDEKSCGEKGVKPNSPKRGGSKKFYVYVNTPSGNCKKISWGDTTGLSVKAKDRGAVRSFVARHKCKQANDRTTARYWSCRTPRYKSLGVKGGQWW